MTSEQDLEATWFGFWLPILMASDGTLDMDQLKRELHDFKKLMDSVSIVYDELTGSHASRPMTDPRVVIRLAREEAQRWADHFCDVGECKCAMAKEDPE